MTSLTPLPLTHTHTITRLTHTQAHHLLTTFLLTADSTPSLRPDSHITPHSIQSSTSSSSSNNITLAHLERIRQGIAGKRVGVVEFGGRSTIKRQRVDTGEQYPSSPPVRRDVLATTTEGEEEGQEEAVVEAVEMDDWQDKSTFEHAQVDETGDIPGRDPADPNDDDEAGRIVVEEGMRDDMEVRSVAGQGLSRAEKEARKLKKKERMRAEKVTVVGRGGRGGEAR